MNSDNILIKLRKIEYGLTVYRKNDFYSYPEDLCFSQNTFKPCYVDRTNIFYDCKISKNNNNKVIAYSSSKGFVFKNMFSPDIYYDCYANLNNFNSLAWSEHHMKLVIGCEDGTSKLIHEEAFLFNSTEYYPERSFNFNSPVKSVTFCSESPYLICGGTNDGCISIWDIRILSRSSVIKFNCGHDDGRKIIHPSLRTSSGISSVIFKDINTVLSSSLKDREIKVWDLRSLRIYHTNRNPLPFKKFCHGQRTYLRLGQRIISPHGGFNHMIMNAQQTEIYASSVYGFIYRYLLHSTDTVPVCQYKGFRHGSNYSKISLSPDDRYLFSGCKNKSALMWLTDYPHNEKPQFQLVNNQKFRTPELCVSDWYQKKNLTKLVACCNLFQLPHNGLHEYNPMIWGQHSKEEKENCLLQLNRIPENRPRAKQCITVPIKYETDEIKARCMKETEKNLKNWDTASSSYSYSEEMIPKLSKKRKRMAA